MSRLELSVLVPALPPVVFAYASDWQRWSEWFEGVSGFRSIGEVPRGNGARYAYKARLGIFRAEVVTEIADFVENVGWTGIGRKGMPHTTHWSFEPCGDQTRFTYALEYQIPVAVLGRLIDSFLLKPQWRRTIETSLANFRRQFESSAPSSEPIATKDDA
jgi:uncharacterized membrane protein